MRVPGLDLSEQYGQLAESLRREIDEVLSSQQFILGPKVGAFEAGISRYCGVTHAIGMSSGTDAWLALLMVLGIGPGDAVITSGYTFFATAGCIARVGATPVFVDIEPATYNMSPPSLEALLNNCSRDNQGALRDQHGRRLRAIVPVHLFGLCCEMEAITAIAEKYQLPLIEDAAQALGAICSIQGELKQAGTVGMAGFFSFYPTKNLGAAGDAGMVVCHDDDLARRLKICRQHGMEPRYFHHVIGGNFRLDELQAAVLKVKLPHLDEWSTRRREKAEVYRERFDAHDLTSVITLPAEPYRHCGAANHHIYHQFVIRCPQRDALRSFLEDEGIGTAVYYPLGLHQQPCFQSLVEQRSLPETEKAARETLALPMYPELRAEQQEHVVASMAKFYERHRTARAG